jgi:hypothetical protein
VKLTIAEVLEADNAMIYINGEEYQIDADMIFENTFEGIFAMNLSEKVNEVSIGLFVHSETTISDTMVSLKRLDGYRYQPISIWDFQLTNAARYQDAVMADEGKESIFLSPLIYLVSSGYILYLQGEWEDGETSPIMEVFHNGEVKDIVSLTTENREEQLFKYNLGDYGVGEWQFKVISDENNQLKIYNIDLNR